MKDACVLGVALCLLACAGMAQAATTLYVAPRGNDAWSGTRPNRRGSEGPFRTLERARDEIRKLKKAGPLPAGGVVVELQGGTYELARAFELGAEDSGTPEGPILYRSRPGQRVRLVGGKVVGGWHRTTDPAVLRRLDESARGKVWQADLKAEGVADLGKMEAGQTWGASQPGLEVFFNDEPMTLARWPNEGFVKIPEVLGPTPRDTRGTVGCVEGIFAYEGDRPARWTGEKDVMLHGYWFWDWADQRLKVGSIDTGKRIITLEPEPLHGFGYRKGMYYYAYNLLPELDQPGEWYLDRDAGTLYFWPPSGKSGGAGERGGRRVGEWESGRVGGERPPAGRSGAPRRPLPHSPTLPLPGQVTVSIVPTLVEAKDLSHVTFRGLTFEGTRGTALSLANSDHVRVEKCTIRNTGGWGMGLSGKESGIVGCDFYNLADGGISVDGGDRTTLTPAGLTIDNCHFHRFGRWNPICKPAVSMNGVGNRVTHCLIDNAPHIAIMWGGNDHLFEYNEFHSVVYGANDAGIMYAGFDPTMRGHVIRHNYFHHVYGFRGQGCNGVYLDDMFCSATIYGNVFYQVPRAAFIGGGHDNVVENNVFVDCRPALHVDSRALGWAAPAMPTMKERLEAVPYKEEPWRTRFPQLLTYWDREPATPGGNLVARNICWGGSWDEIEGSARPGVQLVDNLVGEDPRFVDAERGNFQLRDDSPAFRLGFKRIPVERIGLYADPLRATWPVKTEVRMPQTAKKPVFVARRTRAKVVVDGTLGPAEWGGLRAEQAMVVEQDLEGEKVAPASRAWLFHDGVSLLVAVDNTVDPSRPLKRGDTWGTDDAVELAFRRLGVGPSGPLLILRGYPSGHFASSNEAGAPADAVKRAAEGVEYAASVPGSDRWTAEWRIPLASLGIDPAKTRRFAFSLTVRKTGGPEWVLWVGTHHATWNADNAGCIHHPCTPPTQLHR